MMSALVGVRTQGLTFIPGKPPSEESEHPFIWLHKYQPLRFFSTNFSACNFYYKAAAFYNSKSIAVQLLLLKGDFFLERCESTVTPANGLSPFKDVVFQNGM